MSRYKNNDRGKGCSSEITSYFVQPSTEGDDVQTAEDILGVSLREASGGLQIEGIRLWSNEETFLLPQQQP
jgi:hypothetical protein